MKRIFESTTLKLTGWYVLVLASICLMFSLIVYQISIGEVERKLDRFEARNVTTSRPQPPLESGAPFRAAELDDTRTRVIITLIYVNITVLTIGGVASYFFARRTLQPLRELHEKQGRFISDASHELRTPLATMKTEIEVALRDPSMKKSELEDLLKSNKEEVDRLTKLTKMLLELSTSESTSLVQASFDLHDTARTATARYPEAKKRLTIEPPRAPLTVIGNQQSIEELITILVDNALKYSPPTSTVVLRFTEQASKVTLSIENSGKGISSDQLPHIFDRFYRGDSSRTGNNGYGLGLALAKQISDLHHADLHLESTPNQQTVARFSLPIPRNIKAKYQN